MTKKKICNICNTLKGIEKFHKRPRNIDGLNNKCNSCQAHYDLNRKRSLVGKAKTIYDNQLTRSKKRKHKPPTYTKDEFIEYCLNSEKFLKLHKDWVISDYNKWLAPSIDRKDDYKGYSFDNIQVMTWQKNRDKYDKDQKEGINNKRSKSVLQFDLDGNFIKEYYSGSKAARETKVGQSHINICCLGKVETAGGFVWKYKDSILNAYSLDNIK